MKYLAITITLLLSPLVAFGATTLYVDAAAECPGTGTIESPFCSILSCNSALSPGDRCSVYPGTYPGYLKPNSYGDETERIWYECASQACVIEASAYYVLDLYNRSGVTVDGFRFEGEGTRLRLSGPYSTANHVVNVEGGRNVGFMTSGGTGTTLERFSFHATTALMNVGNLSSNGGFETGTVLKDGVVRGGDTSLRVGTCTDCEVDGVTVAGAWTYSIEIEGAVKLLIQNSHMLASGLYGNAGPFIKDVDGLDLLNNAISRGWYLPSPGYSCGLSGTILIRNNIFVNAGKGVNNPTSYLAPEGDCGLAAPAVLDVDYNAYVGADNLVDDPYTAGDDTAPILIDSTNAPNVMLYNWAEWDAFTNPDEENFESNSIVFEDTEYGRADTLESVVDGQLWGRSAPFWGAIVMCASNTTSFETNSSWAEGLKLGDRLEFDFDGIVRQITAITSGTGSAADGCQRTIQFSPALPAPAELGDWFMAYPRGGAEIVDKHAIPLEGSPVIGAGDPDLCGLPLAEDEACDIGPKKFVYGQLLGAVISGQADKTKLKWTRIVDAAEYEVYRGNLHDLASGNYGDCVTPFDPNPADTTYQDVQNPPPGSGFFYILESTIPGESDGLGSNSLGQPREPSLRCS